MTKEEDVRHLKDHLFHGLKCNLCNAIHYMYDKLDSQYSQLVMALRKAETETLRSSVPEVRATSAVVGSDMALQAMGASSEPLWEALTQQIAYLMSAVTNQTNQNLSKSKECNDSKSSNGNGKYLYTKFQKPKRDKKDMKCWGCRVTGHSWRECFTSRQGNNLPFRANNQTQNRNDGQNLNGQQGEET